MDVPGNNVLELTKHIHILYFIWYNNLMKWKEKYYKCHFMDKEAEAQKWNDFYRGIVVSRRNTGPRILMGDR